MLMAEMIASDHVNSLGPNTFCAFRNRVRIRLIHQVEHRGLIFISQRELMADDVLVSPCEVLKRRE